MADLSRVLAETFREAQGKPSAPAPATPRRELDEPTAQQLADAGRGHLVGEP